MQLEGSSVLEDVRHLEHIRNLQKGVPIYVRVAAMNMKGYSQFANANPAYGVPSSEYLSRLVGKPTMWFPNRSDTNRAVQAQKGARSLKFRI